MIPDVLRSRFLSSVFLPLFHPRPRPWSVVMIEVVWPRYSGTPDSVYWIALSTLEKMLLAFDAISRPVPTTI